jgi:hypothetical protein
MLILRLVEFFAVLLILVTLFSQIIAPLLLGEPMFPFFRKRKKLEKALAEATEDEHNAEIEKEIEKKHQKRAKQTNKDEGKK